MRMNINHATKAGVTVSEYRPLEKRDPDLAQKAMRVHINYSVSRAVTGKFDLA